MNKVVLDYIEEYDFEKIKKILSASMEKLNFSLKPKSNVLLKICLPEEISPDSGRITHPTMIRAFATILKKMGHNCIIADSPYVKYNEETLERLYLNTGMLEVENQTECTLNTNLKTTTLEAPDGVQTKSLTLLDVINDVDAIINIGKVQLSDNLGYVGAVANLFGLVPGDLKNVLLNRFYTQTEFNDYCLDIYTALKDKICLNVLDGVVALEANRTPRLLSCIAMSKDIFDLDATMLDILGIRYAHTVLSQAKDRNYFKYYQEREIEGEPMDKFKIADFALMEFNCDSPIKSKRHSHNVKSVQHHVTIDKNKCKGCSICASVCPTGAIMMKTDRNGELYAEVNYSKCIFCMKCHTACPYHVVEEVQPTTYRKVQKDISKYNN